MKRSLCALLLVALVGCASPLHVPVARDYPGPTAELSDTGFSESSGKAQFFAVAEIDGKAIDNAMYASRRVSDGRGFTLTTIFVQRSVPIVPMKLKLVATHQTAAPIHEIASRAAGTFLTLDGVVDFTPVAGGNYVVKGELKPDGSSVWVEEERTGRVVTEKVRSKR